MRTGSVLDACLGWVWGEKRSGHMTDVDWNFQLVQQLDWHWREQLQPRLNGLTDEEYRWEPVPGAWNVRPRGTGTAPAAAGTGEFTIDFAMPEPDPPPVTTIAWRLGHIVAGVLGMRSEEHTSELQSTVHLGCRLLLEKK